MFGGKNSQNRQVPSINFYPARDVTLLDGLALLFLILSLDEVPWRTPLTSRVSARGRRDIRLFGLQAIYLISP